MANVMLETDTNPHLLRINRSEFKSHTAHRLSPKRRNLMHNLQAIESDLKVRIPMLQSTRTGLNQTHAAHEFLTSKIGNLQNLNPKLLQIRIVQRRNAEMRSTRTVMSKLSPLSERSEQLTELSNQYEPYSSQRLIIGLTKKSVLKVQGIAKTIQPVEKA